MLQKLPSRTGGFRNGGPRAPAAPAGADRTLPAFRPKPAPKLEPTPEPKLPPPDAIEAAAATSPGVPRLLKPKEVAERLAVSERTLERWRITGEGPTYLSITRATVRYTAEAVDAFLADRAKASTAQR